MQQKPGAGLAANAAQRQRFVRMLKAMMQMLSSFSREAEWSTTKHLRNLEWLCADARHAVGKFFISSVVSLSTAAGARHCTTETYIRTFIVFAWTLSLRSQSTARTRNNKNNNNHPHDICLYAWMARQSPLGASDGLLSRAGSGTAKQRRGEDSGVGRCVCVCVCVCVCFLYINYAFIEQ